MFQSAPGLPSAAFGKPNIWFQVATLILLTCTGAKGRKEGSVLRLFSGCIQTQDLYPAGQDIIYTIQIQDNPSFGGRMATVGLKESPT